MQLNFVISLLNITSLGDLRSDDGDGNENGNDR